jgi:hypothetical protein
LAALVLAASSCLASSLAVFFATDCLHCFFDANIAEKLEPDAALSALQYCAAFLKSDGEGSAADAATGASAASEMAAARISFFICGMTCEATECWPLACS